jgi:hypothetical protein
VAAGDAGAHRSELLSVRSANEKLRNRPCRSRVCQTRARWAPADQAQVCRDGGMVTVFTALAALALLLMVGLVVDGAGRMRALGRADRVAAEAARAGVEAAESRGRTLVLDRPAARAAASSYLRAAGVAGTVTVTGPRTVAVVVTVTGTDIILGLVGSGTYAVTGSAQATLSVGVETGDGG